MGIQFVSGPLRGMSAWFNKKRQKPNPVDANEELPVGDGNEAREQSDYSQKKAGEAETYDATGHVQITADTTQTHTSYNPDGSAEEIFDGDNHPKLDEIG